MTHVRSTILLAMSIIIGGIACSQEPTTPNNDNRITTEVPRETDLITAETGKVAALDDPIPIADETLSADQAPFLGAPFGGPLGGGLHPFFTDIVPLGPEFSHIPWFNPYIPYRFVWGDIDRHSDDDDNHRRNDDDNHHENSDDDKHNEHNDDDENDGHKHNARCKHLDLGLEEDF